MIVTDDFMVLSSFLSLKIKQCVCVFVSSVVPVWTLRRATWSWTAGNKISPPPSSASPRRPPTRLTRASPPRPPPYPASCATPGPPPTPTTLSRSPPYNLRPRPRLPQNTDPAAPPANLPMNSELPLNSWSWTRGTASRDLGDKYDSDGFFEYLWFLSLLSPCGGLLERT